MTPNNHLFVFGRVILPARNRKDVQADLPESVREQMSVAYVSRRSGVRRSGRGVRRV